MLTLEELASRLSGVRKGSDGWFNALCPAHDDHHQSFSFCSDGRGIQFKCHAGCDRKAILDAMGLTERDVWEPDDHRSAGSRIEATYQYHDEHGQLLYETVRLFPKSFYQRRPATAQDPLDKVKHDADGREWVNSLTGSDKKPIRRVLYQLPEVIRAVEAGNTIFLVEGEKDANTLGGLGLDATTSPQGAGKWRHEYACLLVKAVRIVICPDNDPPTKNYPGQRHAVTVVRSLLKAGVASEAIRMVEVPEHDVSDWVAAGGTADELQCLADDAPDGRTWARSWERRLRGPESVPSANAPQENVKLSEDLRNTDKGNADRLVEMFGEDLLCDGDEWYVWDGKRYVPDIRDRRMELGKRVAEKTLDEALAIDGDKEREAAIRAARRSFQVQRLRAMVELAASDPRVRVVPDDLDADRDRLNVINGTLNLRSGVLHPHCREDLLTRMAPVEYKPEATCPQWESFLTRIMLDRDPLVRFLQRLAGSCLSGEIREHVFHIFYGLGANGKGTLIRVLQRILGNYAVTADINTFLEQSGNLGGARHQEDVARLKGARFVAAEEASPGKRLNLGRIKTLTGNDRINARMPYAKRSLEFAPEFTLVLAVNHRPSVPASDHGTWRRIKLIPFEATISGEEQRADPDFEKRLAEEDPGILNWMLRGCLDWQQEGLGEPDEVTDATREYQRDTDPLQRFLDERCVMEVFETVSARDLRTAYEEWCRESDEDPLSAQAFGRRLTDRQIGSGRGPKGEKTRTGIGLRKES